MTGSLRLNRIIAFVVLVVLFCPAASYAQFESPNTAGAAGGTCTTGHYAFPDSNGYALKCVSGVWVIVAGSGGIVSIGSQYQMAYYSATGTTVSGDANITTDSGNNLNIGTTLATGAALKIATLNALSFPTSDSGLTSLAIGPLALSGQTVSGSYSNIGIGYQTLSTTMTTAATANTAVGFQALQFDTSGSSNAAFGNHALNANTTGVNNMAFGTFALAVNQTGGLNVGVGVQTLSANISGFANIAVGNQALVANTSGGLNTAIGSLALGANITGGNNVGIGYQVGSITLMSGTNNILIGTDATTDTFSHTTSTAIGIGSSVHPGTGDIAIGYQALKTNAGDNLQNTAIGYQAMASASMTTAATADTAVGYQALNKVTTGASNTAVGQFALATVQTGQANTAVGEKALLQTTGGFNTAYGNGAGLNQTSGGDNTLIGNGSGQKVSISSQNTTVGSNTGSSITSGGANTVLGYNVASITLNTGSNNILIGTGAAVDTPAQGTNNFLNIGNLIYGTSIGTAATPGNVGIGTTTPSTGLFVATHNTNDLASGYSSTAAFNMSGTDVNLVIGGDGNSINAAFLQSRSGGSTSTIGTGNYVLMLNPLGGNVGVNGPTSVSTFAVNGGVAIGTTYAGTNTAASNNLIVQGSVGIGTATPTASLEISGNMQLQNNFAILARNSSGASTTMMNYNSTDDMGVGGASNNDIIFFTAGSERFRAAANGVGIGTTSVTNKLDVNGAASIGYKSIAAPTNGLLVSGNVGIGTTSPLDYLSIGGTPVGNSTNAMLNLGNNALSGANGSGTYIGVNAPSPGYADYINFQYQGSTRAKIDNIGNILGSEIGILGNSEYFHDNWGATYEGNSNHPLNVNNSLLVGYIGGGSTFPVGNILASGSVGIGTTTPASKLELYGSTDQTTAALTDAGNRGSNLALNASDTSVGAGASITFGNSQSNNAGSLGWAAIKALLQNGAGNSGGDLAFSTRNATGDTALTERMRITYSGAVGIGTTSPLYNLDVWGSSGNNAVLRINAPTSQTSEIFLAQTGDSNIWQIQKANGSDLFQVCQVNIGCFFNIETSPGYVSVGAEGSPGSQLSVKGNASVGSGYSSTAAPTNGLIVQGNLGIGTSSPQNTLDVAGGASIGTAHYSAPSNGMLVSGNVGIGTTNPTQALEVNGSIQLQNVNTLSSRNNSGASVPIVSIVSYNDMVFGGFSGNFANMVFTTNGSERMRIPTGGGLGIGTSAVANKLDVNGAAIIGYQNVSAPSTGLLVKGNVGIGTTSASTPLSVYTATTSAAVITAINGSASCTFTPAVSATSWSCPSDIRLKKDIVDTGDSLAWLSDMRIRDYTVRADNSRTTGVIAQELMINHPEMVHASDGEYLRVDAPNPWRLVKAVQELKAANDDLKASASELKAAAAKLRAVNDSEAAELRALRVRLDKIEAERP